MNSLYAVLFGIIQGFTEFLPVSSSGHLVIAEHLLPQLESPGVLFEVILHAGTVLSILIYLRKTVLKLLFDNLWFLIIGSIPAGVIGLLFDDYIEQIFASISAVGVFLLITALINYGTDRVKGKGTNEFSLKNSFLIGLAQSFAILPGISRSGSTIFAGTRLGISRERAAEFSFLLSIPAILGANILQIAKYGFEGTSDWSTYIVGFIAAFISGYIAIDMLLKLLNSKRFKYFSYYCVLAGLGVLLFMQ